MLRTPAIAHHPHSLFLFAPANPSVRLLGVLSGDEDLHDPSHLHNTPDVGTRYSARYSDVRRVNVRAGGAAPAAHPPPRLGRWAPTPLLDLRVPGMCVRARKHARARARAHTHTHTQSPTLAHMLARTRSCTSPASSRPGPNRIRARAHTHTFSRLPASEIAFNLGSSRSRTAIARACARVPRARDHTLRAGARHSAERADSAAADYYYFRII